MPYDKASDLPAYVQKLPDNRKRSVDARRK
jgi:hypothetical protein